MCCSFIHILCSGYVQALRPCTHGLNRRIVCKCAYALNGTVWMQLSLVEAVKSNAYGHCQNPWPRARINGTAPDAARRCRPMLPWEKKNLSHRPQGASYQHDSWRRPIGEILWFAEVIPAMDLADDAAKWCPLHLLFWVSSKRCSPQIMWVLTSKKIEICSQLLLVDHSPKTHCGGMACRWCVFGAFAFLPGVLQNPQVRPSIFFTIDWHNLSFPSWL